jgi:multidrug efflux pump subunit AcrA (membrane-fusion protein)
MIGKYVLPLLAVIGLALAISTVIQGNQNPSVVPPAAQPAKAPFASHVAGAGMIETRTENIAIGTPVSGIVTAIDVKWGDRVNTGDPLFKIDDRDLQGQLLVAVAKIKEAEANLAKLKNILRIGENLGVGPRISAPKKASMIMSTTSGRDNGRSDFTKICSKAPANPPRPASRLPTLDRDGAPEGGKSCSSYHS